jgi:hypothetical protein
MISQDSPEGREAIGMAQDIKARYQRLPLSSDMDSLREGIVGLDEAAKSFASYVAQNFEGF